MLASCNLKRTSSWNHRLVLNRILDSAQSISNCILRLRDRVIVWPLDQNSAAEGVLHTLNESVLVIAQALLVDKLSEAQVGLFAVLHRVDLLAATGQRDSLTVPALGTANTDDVVAGQDFQRWWIDTLLIDNDEVFVGAIAQALLQLHDLHDTIICELPLRFDQLLSLLCVAPEEARVDLGFFVLETHIEAHNVAILQSARHVTLSAAMVEHETADKARLSGHLMLHVHDLDHVKVDALVASDGLDGVDDDLGEGVGDAWVDLGVERGASNVEEKVAAELLLSHLESLKEVQRLLLGLLEAVNEDSGMDTLTEVPFGLAHELTDEKHIGSCSVTDDIVLSGRCTTNHGSGRVLDLHLVEQHAAIFRQFNLTCATYEPIYKIITSFISTP